MKLATAQFFVTNDIKNNLDTIIKLTKAARGNDADIIHFSECSLIGYYPADELMNQKYDQAKIKSAINQLQEVSKINNILSLSVMKISIFHMGIIY